MNRLIILLATGFYSGKITKAPGTWGSLFGLLVWLALRGLPLASYLGMLLAVFVGGFLVAGSAEKLFDAPDPGCIVIDEILGIFVTLTAAPNHPAAWLIGFCLFRFFDIVKPFPVSWFDRHLHGGIGIMMDDVAAGVYAFISLQILWRIWLVAGGS